MNRATRIALSAYRLCRIDTLARTGPGERLFLASLFAYKRWIEDPHAAFLARHPEVVTGGDVLDVGANVGYTAAVFAGWLSSGSRVHAFEPDALNFARLERTIRRRRLMGKVLPVRVAAGDRDGAAALRLNPTHPGDHRIVPDCLPDDVLVPLTTLDTYCDQAGIRSVKFVKIDVQGYEFAVLRGMERLVERHPRLEISLEYSGPDSTRVIEWLHARRFGIFILRHDGMAVPADSDLLASELRRRGYVDLFASRGPTF